LLGGNAVTYGGGGSADLAIGYRIFAAKAAYCRRDAALRAPIASTTPTTCITSITQFHQYNFVSFVSYVPYV
jgi:hypothetical protein